MEIKKFTKAAVFGVTALTLASSVYVAGTYAKYTETVTGLGTAQVAKFDYTMSGLTVAGGTFNLFDTANKKDSDKTSAETDVATNRIAPGTAGQFALTFENKSEVTVKYTLSLVEESTSSDNIPIEYCTDTLANCDGTDWKSLANINTALSNETNTAAIGAVAATRNISWRWRYTQDDAAVGDPIDTTLGKSGTAKKEITITATVTQVD